MLQVARDRSDDSRGSVYVLGEDLKRGESHVGWITPGWSPLIIYDKFDVPLDKKLKPGQGPINVKLVKES